MAQADPKRVGIIGLGLMGRAMAGRLLAAGWSVCGYDLAAAACDAAAGLGVEVLPDARAVAAETKTIVLSLMTSEDRRRLSETLGAFNYVDKIDGVSKLAPMIEGAYRLRKALEDTYADMALNEYSR